MLILKTPPTIEIRKILFSGDLGRPSRPILRDPIQVFEVDYLVLESTYGDRLHDPKPPEDELARIINESVKRGGSLIIPAFAVGRTQELLFCIRELESKGKSPLSRFLWTHPWRSDCRTEWYLKSERRIVFSQVIELEGKNILKPRQIKFCRSPKNPNTLMNKKIPVLLSRQAVW